MNTVVRYSGTSGNVLVNNKRILRIAFLSIAASLPAFSQTFGEITGEVKDASGSLVPAVTITATNAATNAQRSTTSNEAGIYSFPSLAPGTYNVRAEKS